MADISKIKLAGESTARDIKDAEGRRLIGVANDAISAEVTRATGAEATLQTNINNEASARSAADNALDERVNALEARGRFLSSWDAFAGKPETDPATLPYQLKSGDYFIISKVDNKNQYAAYVTTQSYVKGDRCSVKAGDTTTYYVCKEATTGTFDPSKWEVRSSFVNYQPEAKTISGKSGYWYDGTASTTEDKRELGIGDYYTFDGTKWVWVSNSQKTVSFKNIDGEPTDNLKLNTELLKKLEKDGSSVAGVGFVYDTPSNKWDVPTSELQTALGLEDLAYADTASASYTPAGSISAATITPEGTVAVELEGDTPVAATIVTKDAFTPSGTVNSDAASINSTITVELEEGTTPADVRLIKEDYTPQGTITGSAISGGSVDVTLTHSKESVTDITFESYTPAGTINKTDDSFLQSAELTKVTTGGVKIEGTVSAPTITIDNTDVATVVTSLKAGNVDAASIDTTKFSGGSKVADTWDAGTLPTHGDDSFTAGSFTKGSAIVAATEGMIASVNASAKEGDADYECLIFTAASTDNVMDYDAVFVAPTFTQGTFSQGTLPSFTEGTYTPASIGTGFFSAQKLPVVDGTISVLKSASATASAPTFTGANYLVSTTTASALTNATFTGTSADIKFSGAKYLKTTGASATFTGTSATLGFSGTKKSNAIITSAYYYPQTVKTATFNGVTASLTFSGTTVSNLIPSVINYVPQKIKSATFTGTASTHSHTFTGTAATITVTPDAM